MLPKNSLHCNGTPGLSEGTSTGSRRKFGKRLIRDMWRDRRQKHFLAMINWEAYDLKPLLIEAVCMARTEVQGGSARFLRRSAKTGDMTSTAYRYGIDVHDPCARPRMARLLTKKARVERRIVKERADGRRSLCRSWGWAKELVSRQHDADSRGRSHALHAAMKSRPQSSLWLRRARHHWIAHAPSCTVSARWESSECFLPLPV